MAELHRQKLGKLKIGANRWVALVFEPSYRGGVLDVLGHRDPEDWTKFKPATFGSEAKAIEAAKKAVGDGEGYTVGAASPGKTAGVLEA